MKTLSGVCVNDEIKPTNAYLVVCGYMLFTTAGDTLWYLYACAAGLSTYDMGIAALAREYSGNVL